MAILFHVPNSFPSGSPAAWFSADSLSLSNNDPVSSWTDLTGNGNHLTQGSGALQPTFQTGIQNGLPIIRFDGSEVLRLTGTGWTQPMTVFIVMKFTSWGVNRYNIDGGNVNSFVFFMTGGSPRFYLYAGALDLWSDDLAVNTFGVITATTDGASSLIRINGANEKTGNPGSNNADGLSIGARGGADSNFGEIDVCEIIVYNSNVVSSTNEAALMSKWGIS